MFKTSWSFAEGQDITKFGGSLASSSISKLLYRRYDIPTMHSLYQFLTEALMSGFLSCASLLSRLTDVSLRKHICTYCILETADLVEAATTAIYEAILNPKCIHSEPILLCLIFILRYNIQFNVCLHRSNSLHVDAVCYRHAQVARKFTESWRLTIRLIPSHPTETSI